MGIHDWIDIAGICGCFAASVIAALLGARLARHDAQQKEFSEVKTRVEKIAGWIAGKFGIQL